MGKRITLKMTQKNRKKKIEKKNRRRIRRLEEVEGVGNADGSLQMDTALGSVEGVHHNEEAGNEARPVNNGDAPESPEDTHQSHADDDLKEKCDLDHGDPDAEENRKRKGKWVYQSDHEDDSKNDKPDEDSSDDEIFMGYKEEISEKLGMLPESLYGFDDEIPIGTKEFPAPRMMKKKRDLPARPNGNRFYTEEEFELLTQQALRQSLLESENPLSGSLPGSGSSSYAMKGLSSFDDHFPSQRKRIIPWIPCVVCCVVKPPEHMSLTFCKCGRYPICVDYCLINLGVEEAVLKTRLICPDCLVDLFTMELWELISFVLRKLFEVDPYYRN